MEYLLLIYGNPAEAPAEAQSQEAMQRWFTYTQELEASGALRGGNALQFPETATTVRVRNDETLLTDGPFAETKEILGGYYLIDVDGPRCRARLGGEDAEHHVRVGRGATGRRLRLTPSGALERAAREDGPRVLATLVRHLGGDLALAEDALQDAYAVALATWPRDGVPEIPAAWLTTTARRRAIDRLRRTRALDERLRTLEALAERDGSAVTHAHDPTMDDDTSLTDDRLRLLFACCHPSLALHARVALTVKSLGGLSTAQTARAFLVPEPTMAARLLRARRKVAHARIPFRVPSDDLLDERMRGVLAVVYLVFTEGHTASDGDALTRPDLCAEAIRLGRLLCELMPDDAEAHGLLALMLFTEARRAARTGPGGEPIDLRDQDRRLWDRDAIAEATGAAGALVATARAGAVRAAGGDRAVPRPRALVRGDGLGMDRVPVRRAAAAAADAGRGREPRGRGVVRADAGGGAGAAGRAARRARRCATTCRCSRPARTCCAAPATWRPPTWRTRRRSGERQRGPAGGPGGPAGSGGGGGHVVSSAPPRARVEFCSVFEQ